MIRLRDVLQLAWNNITWEGPNGYTLTLATLIAMTLPDENGTYWNPDVRSEADWQAVVDGGGENDLDREKAYELVTEMNNTQPWN